MYSTASKVCELYYYTRLGKEFRSDLSWWHIFLENWNGLSFMHYIKATPRYHYTMVSKQMPLDLGAVEPFFKDGGFSGSGLPNGWP